MIKKLLILPVAALTLACSNPQPGPDKTVSGAVLGAAWGAGAGAVIGNQLEFDPVGEGAAVGAGFGAVSGALQGAGYDLSESALIKQQEQLDALKVTNQVNTQQISDLQCRLDNQSMSPSSSGLVHQVYFDVDSTSLRNGSIANLERIANSLKQNNTLQMIEVIGHTDDSGDNKYNKRLALARARSVASYLSTKGLAVDRIDVESFGAKRPVASNTTEAGRQLNRRVEIYVKNFNQ